MSGPLLRVPPSPVSLPSRKRSRNPTLDAHDEGSPRRPKITNTDAASPNGPWPISIDPQRPSLAVFDSRFSQATGHVYQAIDHFLARYDHLEASDSVNAELENIADELRDHCTFHERYPEVRPIILLGASAAGKSSATNNVLGEAGAAAVSPNERGTYKVIRYLQALPGQASKFVVKVYYFSRAELEDLVTSKVNIVFDYLEASAQGEADGDGYDSDDDGETYHFLKHEEHQRYTTAINFFHAPLRELAEFKSEEKTTAYFQSCLAESRHETASLLVDLLEGIKSFRETGADNIEHRTAENFEQLADIFREVCRPTVALPGTLQPSHPVTLVREVCVHLDNDLLAAGVVLVDSPGVTDTNTDVVDTAFKALREAGTAFVFAEFQRAKDKPEINKQLSQCILAERMHDTHLVLSKVDMAGVPNSFERGGHDRQLVASLESAEALVSQLRAQSEILEEQQMDAELECDDELELRLSKQTRAVLANLADAQSEVLSVSTKMHGRKARLDMRDRFRDLTRKVNAPVLSTLVISNSGFETLEESMARNPRKIKIKDRDLIATGIPELRAIMYRSVTVGKLEVLAAVLQSDLPSAFDSVLGLVNRCSVSNKVEASQRLETVYKGSDKMLARQTRSLKRLFSEAMTSAFVENRKDWSEQAVEALGRDKKSNGWRQYRQNTFRAFCSHDGKFKAPSNPEVTSWNETLCDIMYDEMSAEFGKLEDVVEYIASLIESRFKQSIKCLQQDLKGFLGTTDQARNFHAWLATERDRAIQAARTTHGLRRDLSAGSTTFRPPPASLIAKLRHIGHQMTLRADDNGYVPQSMRSVYKECDEIDKPKFKIVQPTGRRKRTKTEKIGAHQLRVELIRSVFEGTEGRTSVFEAVGTLAADSWRAPVDAWAKNMKAVFSTSSKRIRREFERRFKDGEPEQEHASLSAAAVETLKSDCEKAMGEVRAGQRLVEDLQEMEKRHAAAWEEIGVTS